MSDYARTVKTRLRKAGFSLIRNPGGSHEIWGNGVLNVTVPSKIKSRHTANAILKDAGLKKEF